MSLPLMFGALGAGAGAALLRKGKAGRSRRWPFLTLAVALLVAAMFAVQQTVPGLLARLERSPALVTHREWWRALSALFVQDGGTSGLLFNLFWLLVIGSLAEVKLGRSRWALAYFGGGILAEFLALTWQPHGAGNSVAYLALAGALTTYSDQGRTGPLPLVVRAVGMGCGIALAVAHDIHGLAFLAGTAIGVLLSLQDSARGSVRRR